MKRIVLFLLLAFAAAAQNTPPSGGGGSGSASWISCVGTPGATAGAAGSVCVVPATGAAYACKATSPATCSSAGDWQLIPASVTLAGDANGPSTATVVQFHGVSVLPPASTATPTRIYHMTAATTANVCPAAGDSGGTATADCYTDDNVAYKVLGGPPQSDIPAFVICTTAGCQAETTFNNWFASAPAGITFDECGFALQTAPTVQSVIVDIQTAAGVSIFGATKLVLATGATATNFQATFASSPYTAAKGAQFKAVVTQSDTGGAALGGYVKCRVH
jgi:hypothetical protein